MLSLPFAIFLLVRCAQRGCKKIFVGPFWYACCCDWRVCAAPRGLVGVWKKNKRWEAVVGKQDPRPCFLVLLNMTFCSWLTTPALFLWRASYFVKKGSNPHSKNFCDEKFFDPLFGQKRRAFSCYFDVKIWQVFCSIFTTVDHARQTASVGLAWAW